MPSRPSAAPNHVLRYLGRYTHRVAISNHRLTSFDGEHVSFRWRDHAHGGKQRVMTLGHRGVLTPLFPSCFAQRLRAHPSLRPAVEPLPQTAAAPGAHTSCSPLRATSRCLCHPCPSRDLWHCPRCSNAIQCASSSASPPHNSISQASIPHDRLRPIRVCRLAACTSSHLECAPSMQNSLHQHVQPHLQTPRLQTTQATALYRSAIIIADDGRPQEAFTPITK